MAFARVQGNTHQNGASSSATVPVTLTGTVGSGNSLKIFVGWASNAGDTITQIKDDKLNTYTLVDLVRDSTHGFSWQSAYLENITNAPQTITATISTARTFASIIADEFSGEVTSAGLDGHAINPQTTNIPSGTKATSGNITPTTSGDLIYGCTVNVTGVGNQTADTGVGYTSDNQVASSFTSEHLVQSVAAAIAATFTHVSSDAFITGIMAFKVAAAAFTYFPMTQPDMAGLLRKAEMVGY